MSDELLWRLAKEAAASGPQPSEQELRDHNVVARLLVTRGDTAIRWINASLAVGFGLACIALLAATTAVALSIAGDPSWGWWWLAGLVLGPLALVLLSVLRSIVDRSAGLEDVGRRVKAGVRIAATASIEVAVLITLALGAVLEGM